MTRIANPEDYIPTKEYNPHNVRPWIIGNEYGALAIAYASHEKDAFDIAANADLLKGLKLDDNIAMERFKEHDGEGVMRLGNAGEEYDSIYAWIKELPNREPAFWTEGVDLDSLLTAKIDMEEKAQRLRSKGIAAQTVPTYATIAGKRHIVGYDVEITVL